MMIFSAVNVSIGFDNMLMFSCTIYLSRVATFQFNDLVSGFGSFP